MNDNRVEKGIKMFTDKFGFTYKKLPPGDVGYRIYDVDNNLVAYAEGVIVPRRITNAYPMPVLARKVMKLYDKRLNPVVIWVCDDGIAYGNINKLEGHVKIGQPLSGGEDIIIEYPKQKDIKYLKGYL